MCIGRGGRFYQRQVNAVDFIAQMQAQIENLVKLQAVELERSRLTQTARALPAEVSQGEADLAAAEGQAATTSAALTHEELLRRRLEREVGEHRQKAARFKVQLDSVKTPAQAEAVEHEIQFSEAEADRLENEEFVSLERTEALEATLAAARADVERLAGALEKIRVRVSERLQENARELVERNKEREALRVLIEPELLTSFDRLVASRGTGLANAANQQCSGCRMGVRPQTWNQLREGELLTCDSCGRLLYWDPAMTPVAKVAPDAKHVGSGRAIRK